MSLFGTVAAWFSGAVNGVVDLAKRAWGAIHTVWHVFGTLAALVGQAWDWMVNGVEWLGSQAAEFAEAASAAVWHILTHVIPEAATWALRRAVGWVIKEAGRIFHWATGLFHTVISWATRELRKVWTWITGAVRVLTHDLRKAWNWITNTAMKAVDLVLHPERLVKWILGHLVTPLLLWMIRSSAPVLVYLLRGFRSHANDFMHTIEDILHDLI